jgi:LPXTG-motif cell wall-anchored protein
MGSSAVVAVVTIPAGTTVATVPDDCVKSEYKYVKTKFDGLQYMCFSTPIFPAKTQVTWEFGLKITKVVANDAGAIEVNPACECDIFSHDINKSNDVAKIVVNPADTGGSGGGSLPITGPQTGLIGAGGALLVAAGIAGFIVARRRRTRFEA